MHSQLSPWACTSTNGHPIEPSGSHQGKCRTNSHELRVGTGTKTERNSSRRSRRDQCVLVLGVGLEGVERRLLVRDGVVNEREAAGAGPRVGLLLPLRQLVPRLRENFANMTPSWEGFKLLAPRSWQLKSWHYNPSRFEDLASGPLNGHYHFCSSRRASRRYFPGRRHPLPYFILPFLFVALAVVFLPRLCSSRTAVPSSPVLHRISPFPAEHVPP